MDEIIFSSSDSNISKQIRTLVEAGKVKKIAPRVYTSNLKDSAATIVYKHRFSILAHLYPNAILSHRSAFEFKPTEEGHIFLTYSYTKKINLPGLVVRLIKGSGPIEGDNPIAGKLYVSQNARAFLENLQTSKSTTVSKTLSIDKIEDKLEEIIRVNGESALNKIRDRARAIAEELGMQQEFNKLNDLISALLNTNDKNILSSLLAIARIQGMPYDASRIALFEKLFIELQTQEFKNRPDKNSSEKAFQNFAFFESYFSNYIEGTVFEIQQAKQIIETEQPIPTRTEDSHDVLGTYQLVADQQLMSTTPKSPDELLSILKSRHAILLKARAEKKPGFFKDKNNRAGSTSFVDLNLVEGTLIKSFNYYNLLKHPFAKAAYLMFIISEVHPFLDGNGRIARVMMNAELVAQGQAKIIIPTVFRDNYMTALRKLTRQEQPGPYIRMLKIAYDFSASIYGEEFNIVYKQLQQSNAFLEHTEGKLVIIER